MADQEHFSIAALPNDGLGDEIFNSGLSSLGELVTNDLFVVFDLLIDVWVHL